MNEIIKFPRRLRIVETDAKPIPDKSVATAEVVSGFVAYAMPGLQSIAELLSAKLQQLTTDQVNAIYQTVNGAIESGRATVEEFLLDEIVSDEVARRCAITGTLTPWDEMLGDDLVNFDIGDLSAPYCDEAPANDLPDPPGAA